MDKQEEIICVDVVVIKDMEHLSVVHAVGGLENE